MRHFLFKPLATAALAASLCACFDTPAKPDEPSHGPHLDLAFDQFVLSPDGTQPYDLSSLQKVPAECGAKGHEAEAGGVGILAVATKLIGLASTAIVNELGRTDKRALVSHLWAAD